MPDFSFRYESRQSVETGILLKRPLINVSLMKFSSPLSVACRLRFRVDTGADYSTVPLDFAIDVLEIPSLTGRSPSVSETIAEVSRVMSNQGLSPVVLGSATKQKVSAYPLYVPVEIVDDAGEVGQFEALMVFVPPPCKLLVGLARFLDKFDLEFLPDEFSFHARVNSGVRCPQAGRSAGAPARAT